MTLRRSSLLTTAFLLALGTQPALASSGDAWEEFRDDVRMKCLEQLLPVESLHVKDIQIDPYGSEQYGLAVLHVEDRTTQTPQTVVCVYGKQSQQAEVGSPF